MKLFLKISVMIFIASFFLSECKKYPEGPLMSFKSKEKRVIGNYEVEAFLIDGADSTSQLTCINYSFYSNEGNHHVSSPICTTGGVSGEDWNFENHHNNLLIYVFPVGKTPFPITDSAAPPVSKISWTIQRLTNKQMWLKVEYGGKEYYIKFKKN